MSCLFDSIAYFLKLDGFTVRQQICDYLEQNNPIMDGIETKDILLIEDPEYIRKMRNTVTFGGAPEIRAACNIWGIKIIVYINGDHSKQIDFIPINNCYRGYIELEWQGNHYIPVNPT